MARDYGPIYGWHRGDTIPTEAEGGYAGAASTAAAISLFQGSVDALAQQVGDINIGVGAITTSTADGVTTISWTGESSGSGGGGSSPHTHSTTQISASGTATDQTYLRGDGSWSPPGNGSVASGGCLRFYSTGVEVHENSVHVNNAITGFGPNGDGVDPYDEKGRLVVKHRLHGSAIITAGAFPDETLSERGIIAGVSGGVGTSKVQLVQNGTPLDLNVAADYDKVAGQYSNLWMLWVQHAPNGTS